VVILADQAAKWWAWRHFPDAQINAGGDILTGPLVGTWYAGRVSGAVLDFLDVGLLSIAAAALARLRAPAAVLVPGAAAAGGWASNLLDRLGMHYWTAPGSVRGAVDFIHLGRYVYNIADFFIVGGTPLFLLAAGYCAVRSARRGRLPRPSFGRLRVPAWIPAVAGAGLVLAVGLGAVNYGGVRITPLPHARTAAVIIRH
jgi:lipoprotein signal peptidase